MGLELYCDGCGCAIKTYLDEEVFCKDCNKDDSTITGLEDEIFDKDNMIEELNEKIDELVEDKETLQNEIDRKNYRIDELENEISKYETILDDIGYDHMPIGD